MATTTIKTWLILLILAVQSYSAVAVGPPNKNEKTCSGPGLDYSRLKSVTSSDSLRGNDYQNYDLKESFPVKLLSTSLARSSCVVRLRLQETTTTNHIPIFGADVLATLPASGTDCDSHHTKPTTSKTASSNWKEGTFTDVTGKTFSRVSVPDGYRPHFSSRAVMNFLKDKYELDQHTRLPSPDLVVFPSIENDYLAYSVKIMVPKSHPDTHTKLLHVFVNAQHELNVIHSCVISSSPKPKLSQGKAEKHKQNNNDNNNNERQLSHDDYYYDDYYMDDYYYDDYYYDDDYTNPGSCVFCTSYETVTNVSAEAFLQPIRSYYLNDTGKTTYVQNATTSNGTTVATPAEVESLYWRGINNCAGYSCYSRIQMPTCPDPISDIQYVGIETLKFTKQQLNVLGGLSMSQDYPQYVKAYAHYGYSECNAYYSYNEIFLGDCDCNYWSPLTTIDVVAHELAHGLTDYSSGLYYSGESGGLNEAYSDILGAIMEFVISDSNDRPDFLIGETLGGTGGTLRFMEDPPLDGNSIGSACDFYYGMIVHYSSGVLNRAFVKSVQACHASPCTRTEKECALLMGKLFFYTNLSQLTTLSTFLDAAEKTCSVVEEFFAQLSPPTLCTTDQVRSFVQEGFRAVDLLIDDSCGAEYNCTVTPAPTPAPQIDYSEGCSNATFVALPSVITDSTIDAPSYQLQPCYAVGPTSKAYNSHDYGSSPGLWYEIFGDGGTVVASLCSSTSYGDSMISVWTGTDCDSLQCVVLNDDYCGLFSSVTFETISGQSYYIFVYGYSGSTYDFELELTSSPTTSPPTSAPTSAPLDPEVGCSQSIPLTIPSTAYGNTSEADTYTTQYCGGYIYDYYPGLWYSIAGPDNGDQITASICDNDATNLYLGVTVWTGSCDSLECVGSMDSYDCYYMQGLSWISSPNETYYIFVWDYSYGSASGEFELNITSQEVTIAPTWAPTPAPLDPAAGCAEAILLTIPSTIYGNTSGADIYQAESCGGAHSVFSAGLWYKMTSTSFDEITASLCGSYYDTMLSVWKGSSCDDLECVGGNDDSGSCGLASIVSWTPLLDDEEYFIFVHGYSGSTGNFVLSLTSEVATTWPGTASPSAGTLPPTILASEGTPSPTIVVEGTPSPSAGTPAPSFVTEGTPAPTQGTPLPTTVIESTPSPTLFPTLSSGSLTPSPTQSDSGIASMEDGCLSATEIAIGTSVSDSTKGEPLYQSEGCDAVSSVVSPGSWFKFTGIGGSGSLTASLCSNTLFDSMVSIWTGDDCGSLQCVAANDDSDCGLQSSVTLPATLLGDGYYVFVHGYDGEAGPFQLEIDTAVSSHAASVFRGGPAEDVETDSNLKIVKINSQLTFTFFAGKGRRPAEEDIEVLVGDTTTFFKEEFKKGSKGAVANSFEGLKISDVVPKYDSDPETSDTFVLDFVTEVRVDVKAQVKPRAVAEVLSNASYKDYINRIRGVGAFSATYSVGFKGTGPGTFGG